MEGNDIMDLQRRDLWSSQDRDSNAYVMPGKKKKKSLKQGHEQGKTKKNANLSKSQKRKLRKLKDEKEKALLLKETIENLEKYKIPENVYPLLQCSSNIGQAETTREKRRKAVQYFKAGLEAPSVHRSFYNKGDSSALCKNDPDFDQNPAKQEFDESELLQQTITQQVYSSYREITDVSKASWQTKGVSTSNTAASVEEGLPMSCLNVEKNMPMSGTNMTEGVNLSSTTRPQNSSLDRSLTAPIVVHASRPKEVEAKRKDLPIVMMEQEIMEAINEHSSVIICGETGCGKTTQVPQFLYEAGYGSNHSIYRGGIIGVTQPRRVAVLATAKRVAFELGLRLGKEVGFQVRYDRKIGHSCSIKFMTDGILLREVQTDILLKRYSVIILDEAHERSLNTDILIGMLSRVIQIRQKVFEEQQQKMLLGENISPESMVFPLKVVLMSATLRVEDFVSGRRIFCSPPPVIEVPARQYPVTVHFSKRTEIVDYIGQAYKKVLSIHKRLPPGGILVFLTGQREVDYLCQKLRNASKQLIMKNSNDKNGAEAAGTSEIKSVEGINMHEIDEAFDVHGNSEHQQTDRFSSYEEDHGDLDKGESDVSCDPEWLSDSELEVEDDVDSLNNATPADVLGKDGGLASLKAAFEALAGKTTSNPSIEGAEVTNALPDGCSKEVDSSSLKGKSRENGPHFGALSVLPLYAMLPAAAQLRVFEEIKEGERLVVVATNVAETSLTIPGITYVVDTGREKVKNYNSSNGMETYEVQWISKASAAQRAGRAGRTGPGHCYRLYSSAVFTNIFPDFSVAEISKIPVDGVVLLMKSMGIGKVANFPFPTPPLATALSEADRCLKTLEALDSSGRLTSLGKAMARYPMSPRHSRMLLTIIQITAQVKNHVRANLVLGYAIAAASALSFSSPFIMQFEGSDSNKDGEKSDNPDTEKIQSKQEKSKKKKLKETVKVSRAKFSNPSSDALTIAYALQCFEASGSPVEFCNEFTLHLKTMEEMSKLRKQLLQLVFSENIGSYSQQEFSWAHGTKEDIENAWRSPSDKHPLVLNEEEILCQAICAGWADRIARRFRASSGSSEADRKANAVRYQACMVKETVFLHRWSSLSKFTPEFLVYNELVHTKRPYMNGATSVKSDWLVKYAGSLCSFSAPLLDPKPYYEPMIDQVFCWVSPSFGPHLWELPLHRFPINNAVTRVAVFAYALLEGQVFPCLKSVRKFMAASPNIILRPEASGQRRVGNLINKLNSRVRTIDSCAMLREAWEENPMELHSEILDWFQESFHCHFEEIWSTMHQEIVLEPRERIPKRVKRKKKSLNLA